MSRRQPSTLVSNGVSATTAALNIAGAATDAVPFAKQIMNSAAQISAFAEKIQKKREGMYMLIQKVEIYSAQIDMALAGRVLDVSLQRRLERLYSVFLKIEALVDVNAGRKDNALTRVWRNVVTKPIHAETLVIELDREMQLFRLLTGIQLNLVIDDTARAVAEGARYDGQIRILRDCDIEKRSIIRQVRTDQGTIVWASARVDGHLMVIRYLDPASIVNRDHSVSAEAYQMLDASAHLVNVHGLKWIRESATVDEHGEPCIGLFNDIIRANPSHLRSGIPLIYWNYSEETGIVEQVHDSHLRAVITEQFCNDHGTDRLQRVWDAIRQEQLLVMYRTTAFPVISGNVSLPQDIIAQAQLYLERYTREDDPYWNCIISFVRRVLAGRGANTSSQISISIWRLHGGYTIHVENCTNDGSHIRYNYFWISIPAGCTVLAAVATAAGLPNGIDHSWNASGVFLYRN
ncbi:hypothetical protein EXIGLDRAFT_774267 [Exidia glandulosa HHB12029]|uniref:Uncharacterized protein n=1 Tax=Exidia glandulosa HHB12029 TaxID=1314781 RepID=A0A165ZYB3_EXIGL|nr:hypothetical protein EXIGLDRAFT_774891 [Exidia glandulosa HHB12029]KZV86789.1 hypothetical protein EXIGLDRAFT_774267 [Exidia glandulosa HHB12029]